ncbi:YbdD/YjiX family protein [Saccharomonospora glauca]|uniref:Uncharacterized small protein n=1 Tax=Saccharomonospora glauca K62 TaxID=928724 RepID=I1D1N9_9PSEU|nr:YbdD/YjiX family protein [Saccharomonospora glauca]EIE98863.1 uncharacterized small protein [Saccharomonospora glauca K62]
MTGRAATRRPGLARVGATLARAWRAVSWYVKEVVGENDYEHYVAHLRRHHPEARPVSRREFERAKLDRMASDPGARCC